MRHRYLQRLRRCKAYLVDFQRSARPVRRVLPTRAVILFHLMTKTLTGTLHGTTITLDTVEATSGTGPVSSEGQRVRVVVEPLDDADLLLSPEQQRRLLLAWAEHGPQGPIEDDGGS